jgi:predicted RNase H-like HicB family nuclease
MDRTSGDLLISAIWDDEAKVWVATSDDVPGLVAEADSLEDLTHKLEVLIPELLELNSRDELGDEFPFKVLSERKAVAHRHPR